MQGQQAMVKKITVRRSGHWSRRLLSAVGALAMTVAVPAPVMAQAPAATIEYYHVDALGSVRAVTDANGAVIRTQNYHPFGEGVGVAPGGDPMGFTGKPRDAESGLDYFGARYYAQRTGRFTTVDPVTLLDRNIADPQSWNRYSYAKNNPLRYVDPDGRIWETLWDVGNLVYSGYQCFAGKGCGSLGWDAAATLLPFVPAGGSRVFGVADAALDIGRAARELPAFSKSTIDQVIASAGAMKNSQDTVALNGLKSHIDRGDSMYQGVARTADSALKLIGDVLGAPTRVVVTGNTIDVFNKANQGVRIRRSGEFVGFLNGAAK